MTIETISCQQKSRKKNHFRLFKHKSGKQKIIACTMFAFILLTTKKMCLFSFTSHSTNEWHEVQRKKRKNHERRNETIIMTCYDLQNHLSFTVNLVSIRKRMKKGKWAIYADPISYSFSTNTHRHIHRWQHSNNNTRATNLQWKS